MIEEYFKLLETLNEEQKSALSGYSDAEILKLESLYKVSITGELQAFLKKIGRCDGGLVGDNPFLFYRAFRVSVLCRRRADGYFGYGSG